MKLLLIKAGKAWNTLRRDGIFKGGKRLFDFGMAFLKNIVNVRPGDILFITTGVGDSALYRAHNQAEELRAHGFSTSVTMQDNPFLTKLDKKFKIFVFNRTLHTPAVAKFIEKIKKQEKEIIFDTDDLVFDIKYIHQTDHYKNMSYFEKKQYEKGIGEEILTDPYVKVCTTSTKFIAEKLEAYGKKVFVTTNKLSNQWLDIADRLIHENPDKIRDNPQTVRIGYFSGTIGHNKDLATISDPLVAILEKYPQVKLFIAGPLDLEEKFAPYSQRIIRSVYVPREKHFKNIFLCDIILAPLERDEFSEGKSELKFSEAGLLEVPVVAVRNRTFSGAIVDGENGFLADHSEEWTEKLSQLIENEELRKNMGAEARKTALRDYTTKNSHGEEYYDYLRSRLEK